MARYLISKFGTANAWFDTAEYADRPGAPVRGQLVSFTGHAPRLWGSPALFALFNDDHTRAVAQSAIGALAWLMLAWVVWRIPRNTAVRVIAGGAVLVLGLTAQATSWDFAILSESLSINLGLFALAGLLWWLHERSRVGLALLTVAGLWWTFTRPEIRLMVAALIAGLWISVLGRRTQWRPTAIASGVLAVGVVWCTLIVPNANEALKNYSAAPGATLQEETFYHRLRSRIYLDERVQRVYEEQLGMPRCPSAAQLARDPAKAGDFGGFVNEVRRQCPQLVSWMKAKGDSSTLQFATTAPGDMARVVWEAMPTVWAGITVYGTVPEVLPHHLAGLIFPPVQIDVWSLAGAVLVALVAAVAAGLWRRHRALFVCCVGVVLTAIASAVASLFFASNEYERQGIQETLLLRVAVVVLLAMAVDTALARRRRTTR